MIEAINSFEIGILNFIQEYISNPFFDWFFVFITKHGDRGYIWIVAGIILLFFKKYRKYGVLLLVSLLIELAVCNCVLKVLFERMRPYDFAGFEELLISKVPSFSFPSGHTMSSAVAATILTMTDRRFGYVAIPLGALIAFSRMYLYVHYPSDVVVAALLGVLLGIALFRAFEKIVKPKLKNP